MISDIEQRIRELAERIEADTDILIMKADLLKRELEKQEEQNAVRLPEAH